MEHLVLFTLLFFGCMLTASCKKINAKTMWYTKLELSHNPVYLQTFKGKICADKVSWDLDADVVRNLTDDLWIRLTVASWQQSTSSYRNRLSYDLNVYDLLHRGMNDKSNMLFTMLNNFWKYGTLPMEAPFLKGFYHWRGVKLEKLAIPAYVLQGKYRTDAYTYFKSKKQGNSRDKLMNLSIFYRIQPN